MRWPVFFLFFFCLFVFSMGAGEIFQGEGSGGRGGGKRGAWGREVGVGDHPVRPHLVVNRTLVVQV